VVRARDRVQQPVEVAEQLRALEDDVVPALAVVTEAIGAACLRAGQSVAACRRKLQGGDGGPKANLRQQPQRTRGVSTNGSALLLRVV